MKQNPEFSLFFRKLNEIKFFLISYAAFKKVTKQKLKFKTNLRITPAIKRICNTVKKVYPNFIKLSESYFQYEKYKRLL